MLVIGMEGWPLLPDGQISRKLHLAEKLTRIRIISESAFLELMGLKERQEDSRKTYPTEVVCKLLGAEIETLRVGNCSG